MPRVKEYNREEVLDKATRLFWEKGFASSSMNDIVKTTGLNKHSMYKEFGSKEGLYQACIENFVSETNKDAVEIISRKPLGFSNIVDFFQNRLDHATTGKWCGCMVMNSIIEQEALSDDINKQVRRHLKSQEKLFRKCLAAARDNGEISANKDLDVSARYLLCFLEGLNVMGRKTSYNKKELQLLINEVIEHVRD